MTSLKVLLDDSVSAFSGRDARLTLTVRIDIALQELEQAHATTKAANRSPVKQALKLFRSRSTAKLNVQLESRRVRADDNAAVAALAQEVSSGRRALLSLQPPEILLLQRALRTRRNSVAPVFRLPTEVLAPILELCPTIEDDSPQFHTDNFVSGLRLAHVCRRWREVAMGSARFWTHIVLSRPRWALEMLHRSRVAPLVVGVDITASATKTVAARDLVLAQLPRIRELRVQNARFHSIPSALLSSAPILDTFHLCYDPPARVVEVITPALFAGQAPALRHLSLRFCMLHLDSPLWDNLVSLKLAYASAFLPLFLTRMPHFLLRMAHLQALTLIESNPAELADLEDEGPVTLKLNSLVIEGISWYCYCFLRTVLLPACRIWFRVPYSNSDLRFVWNALESQRGRADDPVICGLKFADVRPKLDGPSPATSQFEVSLFGRSDPTEPRYTVLFTIDPPLPNWREEALYTMMAIMYLEQVSTLTVSSAALRLSTPLLLTHFRSAAFHFHVEPFTEHLEGDPLMVAGDLTRFDPLNSAVYYPRLRKLAFHCVTFTQQHTAVMLDWLAQRRRLNLGIEEIRLVGCTLTSADLGSLGELVGRIYTEDG